jgi:hypothetical protein
MKLAPKLWFAFAISALGLLGSVVVPVCFMVWTDKGQNPVVSLTVLALGGVLALIAILALIATTFSALNLTDRSQALGLPEGTIRAVIALSLIMIFVISALFLFGKLTDATSPGAVAELKGVTMKQLELMPPGDIISQAPEATPIPSAAPEGTILAGGSAIQPLAPTFTVRHLIPISKAGEDFARQVLTMVGTLVVSIASFYFGAQSVQTAAKSVQSAVSSMQNAPQTDDSENDSGDDSGPKIDQLDPNIIELPSSQSEQTIVVTGKSLANVSGATLVGPDDAGKNDVARLTATKLVPEANKLTCVFTVPPNIAIGDWKLQLETEDGVKVEKQKALSVPNPT